MREFVVFWATFTSCLNRFFFKWLPVWVRVQGGNLPKCANNGKLPFAHFCQKLVWSYIQGFSANICQILRQIGAQLEEIDLFRCSELEHFTTICIVNYERYNWRKLILRPFKFFYLAWNWYIATLYWLGILDVVMWLAVIKNGSRFGEFLLKTNLSGHL